MTRRRLSLLRSWPFIVVAAGVIAAVEVIAIGGDTGDYGHPAIADYGRATFPNPDNAGPAIWALATGHLHLLSQTQPVVGSVALLLQAPFARLGHVVGGIDTEYHFGAFACLWVLAVFACALALRTDEPPWPARVLAAAIVIASGAAGAAVRSGHPEELLAAALACAAVWAAVAERARWAGILVGLSIGTLAWTAVALVPTLLASARERVHVVVSAAVTAAVFALPLPLSAPHVFIDRTHALSRTLRVYGTSLWWPVAERHPFAFSTGARTAEHTTLYRMPLGLDRGSGLLVAFGLALVLGIAVHVVRGGSPLGADALALCSAMLFLRSALDPLNLEYYAAPAFAALAAWEVVAARRLPVVALAVVALDRLTFAGAFGRGDLRAVVYVAWSLALLAYLTVVSARARRPVRA